MSAKNVIGVAVGVALGVAASISANQLGISFLGLGTSDGEAVTAGDGGGKKEVLYWVAPMDPNYRRDGPGKSPMGMDLIPVYAGEEPGAKDEPGIEISPVVANNIGIRTAPVERRDLERRIKTVGYIGYDEDKITHVHLRTDGWIDDLRVKYMGQRVKQGDLLFQLYSRSVQNAQAEFQLAANSGQPTLITSARNNLRALGVSEAQIEALARRGKPFELIEVTAAQNGVVTEIKVAEGMYVQPSTTIATIADLSSIWVMVDVFENQSQWVREGQRAEMRLAYSNSQVWSGVVDYIYPMIDPKSRALQVRLRFDNPDEQLKPNMYADIEIFAAPQTNVLAVPREAVIRTGNAERIVTALNNGRFLPVEINTGIESGNYIEVLEGVSEGDRVVTSGQFLIDSESSLTASFQRMTEPEGGTEPTVADADSSTPVGEGMINSLEPLNITHGPIPTLGWPEMAMDFNLLEDVSLMGLAEGDTVRFALAKNADGMYAIASIEKQDVIAATASGVINSLKPLNITHEPIPALGWPTMAMDFKTLDGVELDGLAAGDTVEFELAKDDAGTMAIARIGKRIDETADAPAIAPQHNANPPQAASDESAIGVMF